MPIRQGYVAGAVLQSGQITPGISTDLDDYGFVPWGPSAFMVGEIVGYDSGSRMALFPVTSDGTIKQGYRSPNWTDDFYHRIHITPTEIDLGNVTPPQTRTVEVWNAFLVPKSLTSIVATGDDEGLSFSPTPPMTFQPLQSTIFTLTAGTDVPPTIDVFFDFTWIGADSSPVHVVGVAIIPAPWPQLVPMQETLSWLSDVMTAQDGTEQAVSLRETPRQVYSITFHPKDFTGAQHAFVGGYGRGFAVPSIDEGQPCSAVAGQTQLLIDTTTGDWRDMVMIWSSETAFEIIEIDSVLPDRLLLKRAILTTRTGRAYPTAAARAVSDPVRTTYGFAGFIQVNFEFVKGRDLAAAASPVQWGGYDVLLTPPSFNPLDDSMSQRIEVLDNATGWASHDRYWTRAKIARPMRWVVNRSELWPLRKWLHRRRGQWRPFYQPSFEPDFIPAGDPSSVIGTAMTVLANGYEKQGKTKALAIKTATGYVFADITSVTDAGSTINLVLAQNLTLTYAEAQKVSLMGFKRLASDSVQINHIGGGISEVLAEFLELQ